MSETTIIPACAGETPLPDTPLATPQVSRSSFQSVLRWGLFPFRLCLAVPLCLIRAPGRTLAVLGLLALIGGGMSIAGGYLWLSHHLREARSALEHYHTSEALPHLQVCLRFWPRDAETLFLAARAARRAGAYDEANRYLDRYQEVRGENDENLVLERVLLLAERGELDRVRKYCQSLVEANHPATPLILEGLARGYLHMYRLQEAGICVAEWLERDADNPRALFLLAQMYDEQGRMTDAMAAYRRALEADANLDEARLQLSNLLVQMGLGGEALPHLEYLTGRFPDNLRVRVQLAQAHDQTGESGEAEKILADVLARQPNYGQALSLRGKMALRDGRLEQAEEWLRQAILAEPGDRQAHYQLYQCLEKSGKKNEAEKEQVYLQQIEDDMKRIQDITTIYMQQRPHDPALHYEMGRITMRAGATEEALRWLHSALQEDPDHAPTHEALMEYYQRIGDFGRAAQHRQKAGIKESGSLATPPENGKRL